MHEVCPPSQAPGMVPFSHTVQPSVCRLGTMRRVMVPIRHTVKPSVCRLGKVPGERRPGREAQCTKPRPNRGASVQSRAVRTGGRVPTGVCTVSGSGDLGFAHWRGRSGGGLYSGGRFPRTNPRPIVVSSVQGRPRREALTSDLSPCHVPLSASAPLRANGTRYLTVK